VRAEIAQSESAAAKAIAAARTIPTHDQGRITRPVTRQIGVAVRDGTPAPDISIGDAFKKALAAAKFDGSDQWGRRARRAWVNAACQTGFVVANKIRGSA
jgi:hypothetical protein